MEGWKIVEAVPLKECSEGPEGESGNFDNHTLQHHVGE